MHTYLDADSIQNVEWVNGQISLSATKVSLLSYIRLVCSQVIKRIPVHVLKAILLKK